MLKQRVKPRLRVRLPTLLRLYTNRVLKRFYNTHYLSIQLALNAILAHEECVRFIGEHTTFWKLGDFELVRVANLRRDVQFVR